MRRKARVAVALAVLAVATVSAAVAWSAPSGDNADRSGATAYLKVATGGPGGTSVTETWRWPDGSARIRMSGESGSDERSVPPGTLSPQHRGVALNQLSADDGAVIKALEDWAAAQPKWAGNTLDDASVAYKVWDFLQTAASDPAAPEPVRRALLRAFARVDGAVSIPLATDQSGRRGRGVVFEFENGPRFRNTVVIDDNASRLLGINSEVVATNGSTDPNYSVGPFSFAVFDLTLR